MVFRSIFRWTATPSHRIYGIGDVGGNDVALDEVLGKIDADMKNHPKSSFTIIGMGDYVDRGLGACKTLDRLVHEQKRNDGVERIFLKGNHDDEFLNFLTAKNLAHIYGHFCNLIENGGLQTFANYGVYLDPADLKAGYPDAWNPETLGVTIGLARKVQKQMQDAVPPAHIDFLKSLTVKYEEGNLFFCHGGVDPSKPLAEQDPLVLTGCDYAIPEGRDRSITREFATYNRGPIEGKTIVIGHSKVNLGDVERARISDGRIPTDTGAYNRYLTAVIFERDHGMPDFDKVGQLSVRSRVPDYDRYDIPRAEVAEPMIILHDAPSLAMTS